jgi:hypothetical protein
MVARNLIRTGLLSVLFVTALQAQAAEKLVIKADQSQVITLPATPGAVVVGNPSLADVTVAGNQLFVHGRLFGTTNVIVLDNDGNQSASFEVTVMRGGSDNLVVYKSASAFSYVCSPDCEMTFHVGDNISRFAGVTEEAKVKIQLATGNTGNDDQEGQTPQ